MKVRGISIMIVLFLLIPFAGVLAVSNSQTDIFSSPSQSTEESMLIEDESTELPSQTTLKAIHEDGRDGRMRAASSDPNDPNNGGWQQGAEYAPISGSPFLLVISALFYVLYRIHKIKRNERTV